MKRAKLGLAVLLLYGSFHAAAAVPRIASIDVNGCSLFPASEVSDWLVAHLRQPFLPDRLEAITATIREHYRNAGYYGASASLEDAVYAPDSSTVLLTLAVTEGRRSVVASLDLRGVHAFEPGTLDALMASAPGHVLLAQTLEEDIAAVLDRYERAGYALASCRVEDVGLAAGPDVDSASVVVIVDEGPQVKIHEVRIEGNKETRQGVILREARISAGEQFQPDRIAGIRSRLVRLNIFSRVYEPELYMDGPRGGLLLRVEEGKTNTFDGILGYAPGASPGESGYFTGMVTVGMRNLFGTGRKMNLRWQKEDRHSQDLSVGYVEPWVFNWPVNAGADFQQRRQDSTYVRQAGTIRLELMASDELSLSLLGMSESVIPSSDTLTARVPRSSSLGGGAEVVFDTRDDLYSPEHGARYRADFHYGRKRVAATTVAAAVNSNVQRFGLDLELYLSPFTKQVIALSVHGRQVQGGGVDESQMFRFGGASTLRGYRENQFLGARVAWTNAEYRLLLARRSFVYGFIDTGYYSKPANESIGAPSLEAFHYGYGIGLRFDTPLGNMGVSFALGKGDSFAQGKIHVGVIGDF
jgi:outer membrane protein insertion porin family